MDTQGPWSVEESQRLNELIDAGYTKQGIINALTQETSRSAKSVERKLIKVGFLNRHGLPWNRSWGHISK